MKARQFDEAFDAGEDVSGEVDWEKARRPNLALKRVMLSSGGLGYFEYEATVEGDATLRLTVSLEQVDDVLKSLVVYDDKGTPEEGVSAAKRAMEQDKVDLIVGGWFSAVALSMKPSRWAQRG